MKRADLEALGIEKEKVDKIMEMNGADIEAKKKDVESLKEQLKTANESLKNAEEKLKEVDSKDETITNLQKQIEDYNEKEKQRKEAEEEAELTARISDVFPKDREFTSDYVKNGLVRDIKEQLAKDSTKGAKEIFDSLTKDEKGNEIEGIFKNAQHGNLNIPGATGGNKTPDEQYLASKYAGNPFYKN